MNTKKKQRRNHSTYLLKEAFQYYNIFTPRQELVNRIKKNIYKNKEEYCKIFSKRVSEPLTRLSGDINLDKKLLICFLRRLCKELKDHVLLSKRQNVMINNNKQ